MRSILASAALLAASLVEAVPTGVNTANILAADEGVGPIPSSALDPDQRAQSDHDGEALGYLEMGCWAKENGALVISYQVHIGYVYSSGHEFNGGNGLQDQCTNAFWALEHRTKAISHWSCKTDMAAYNTILHFNNIVGQGDDLSDALDGFYPMVSAIHPFNCPDH